MSRIKNWRLSTLFGPGLMSCAAVALAADSLRVEN